MRVAKRLDFSLDFSVYLSLDFTLLSRMRIVGFLRASFLNVCDKMATRKRKALAALILLEEFTDSEEELDVKSKRRGKTRNWIKRREERGFFHNIFSELSAEDSGSFREMMRMSKEDFNYVLSQIAIEITPKQVTGGHSVIGPKIRLALTLRFLATVETYRSLSFQFRISRAAISYIIVEVC